MSAPEPVREDWQSFAVRGSDVVLDDGVAVTMHDASGPPPYWFSGETTTVLGAAKKKRHKTRTSTTAHWNINIDPRLFRAFERGFLIIGCLRYFGGLHSTRKNSRVDVWLNETQIDGFALRIVPPNHSDYFHRPALPEIAAVTTFRDCQTVYAWPIQRNALQPEDRQRVKVKIEKDVRWDIDYVALLLQASNDAHRVFLSHSWADKPTARMLASRLGGRGIRVWLDEDEIRIGDSLITKIREAIDTVEYVVVLLSEVSVKSEWVMREVDVAMNQEINGRRVKVLPIRLDQCELPGFLLGKLYADLHRPEQVDDVVAMIERRMRAGSAQNTV